MEPNRLELQPDRSMEANLADLPRACNIGTKKNSKGHCESWIGYKLHADVVDGEIPVSLILTSECWSLPRIIRFESLSEHDFHTCWQNRIAGTEHSFLWA